MDVRFDSPAEELAFLRGLLRLQQLTDDILEDCLERRLGLEAAVDTFLAQCARMIHAQGGFVRLEGTAGPVLARVMGPVPTALEGYLEEGSYPVGRGHTLYVSPLLLGRLRIGAIGFLLAGQEEAGRVLTLVRALAEVLDGTVLSFLALTDGRTPLDRLDELSQAHAFKPRGRVGRYQLVTPLGTGGMAQVMVARAAGPEGVGRLVALKRILPHLTAEPEVVEQFLDEARIGMRLSHPNVVTFYDFGEAAGAYYIAMELVRGVELDRVVHGQPPISAAMAAGMIAQALGGLHAAHEARGEDGELLGLVHRDLSPHNLMVGFDGRVKILDFGVAKARVQRTVTLPGIVKGKPLYMSPEQATGGRLDRRSDLFAMGLILYETLTAARPFDRGDDVQSMLAIVHDPLPTPPAIAQDLWRVVERALSKTTTDRFRTAAEMATALAQAGPLAGEDEIARHVRVRFAARLHELSSLERSEADEGTVILGARTRTRDKV